MSRFLGCLGWLFGMVLVLNGILLFFTMFEWSFNGSTTDMYKFVNGFMWAFFCAIAGLFLIPIGFDIMTKENDA